MSSAGIFARELERAFLLGVELLDELRGLRDEADEALLLRVGASTRSVATSVTRPCASSFFTASRRATSFGSRPAGRRRLLRVLDDALDRVSWPLAVKRLLVDVLAELRARNEAPVDGELVGIERAVLVVVRRPRRSGAASSAARRLKSARVSLSSFMPGGRVAASRRASVGRRRRGRATRRRFGLRLAGEAASARSSRTSWRGTQRRSAGVQSRSGHFHRSEGFRARPARASTGRLRARPPPERCPYRFPSIPRFENALERLEIPFNDVRGRPVRDLEGTTSGRRSRLLKFFYKHYFSVESHGIEHVPTRGRAMLVGNHSGGVAARRRHGRSPRMFFEMEPPRLAQGMAEKFINKVPFASQLVEPHRAVHGPARARRAPARRRAAADGLPRGRARNREALQGALLARGLRHRLHAARAEDEDAHRPLRLRRRRRGHPDDLERRTRSGSSSACPTSRSRRSSSPLPLPAKLEVDYSAPMVFEGTGTEDDEVVIAHVEQVKARIAQLIERADGAARGRRSAQRRVEGRDEGPHPRHRGPARQDARRAPPRGRARGDRHRPAALPRRAGGRRDARGRHPQARRRGRVPQGAARGGDPHGDGDAPRGAERGSLPHQPRRHARGVRALARPTASSTSSSSAATPTTAPPPTRRSTTPRTSRRWRWRRSPSSPISSPPISTPARRSGAIPSFVTTVLRMVYTLGPTGHGTLGDVPPRPARADDARLRSALPVHARGGRRAARSCSRSRRGRAASSTSPGRSRCRSRSIIRETGRTNIPLPELALRRCCSDASACRSCPRRARAHQVSRGGRRQRLQEGDRLHPRDRREGRHARVPRRVSAPVALSRQGRQERRAPEYRGLSPAGSGPQPAHRRRAPSIVRPPHIHGAPVFSTKTPGNRRDQAWLGSCSEMEPVLPFSKRPPPPDEYLLRSGDLEARRRAEDPYSSRTPASYAPPSYAQPAPHAPPPAFVRQAAHTPYGFTQRQQQQYGQRTNLSAPPPPHSLAPMAMQR